MSKEVLVRAWKDEECGAEIESPVGNIELADTELDLVAGGYRRRGGGYNSGRGSGPTQIVICQAFSIVTCLRLSVVIVCNLVSVNVDG
jgi:hypothetical protein